MSVKTPVRIYILWHASFTEGLQLGRHIYYWFRLPTGEGIPVYFRCWSVSPNEVPEIPDTTCDLNIIVPLVEPNMVASLPWRRYVEELTSRSIGVKLNSAERLAKYHILPVALHPTAYQMPSLVKQLNFIRHISSEGDEHDDFLLTKLTEALCLRLREHVMITKITGPIKIFLSYARADGADVPKEIKNFIQTETQCQTFFDENDISYGQDFGKVIGEALENESAGLLVIQGDNYADRPWCRKEIREFLKPHRIPHHNGSNMTYQFSIMPAVVVTNFVGRKTARTIPELGHTSCLQWRDNAARTVVVTMLREILFSSFYRLLAQAATHSLDTNSKNTRIVINRPPDPVMLEHLFRETETSYLSIDGSVEIHHPGHGLSNVEREGLTSIYRENVQFMAFGEGRIQGNGMLDNSLAGIKEGSNAFTNEVLAVSVSNSSDALKAGVSDDHTVELLRAILRPLFGQGISLLYGGSLPKWQQTDLPWIGDINFTKTFLDHLLAERSAEIPNTGRSIPQSINPRLFNLSAWPHSTKIGVEEEAQWINICSFIRVDEELCNITDPIGIPKEQKDLDDLSLRRQRVNSALCLAEMRKFRCGEIVCDITESKNFSFRAIAHLFIGGKINKFNGVMPGVWEEILRAFEADRPTYIVYAARGATGMIARWILLPPDRKPNELNFEYFIEQSKDPDAMKQLAKDLIELSPELAPQKQFDKLWAYIDPSNQIKKVPSNGLTDKENETLYTSENFSEIARLICKGLLAMKSSRDH